MPSPRPCNVSRVLSPHPSCIYFSWAAIDSGEPNRPSRHSSPCPADAAGVVVTLRATARALASKHFWRVQRGAAAPIGPGDGRPARRGTRPAAVRRGAAVSERGFCRCASTAGIRVAAQCATESAGSRPRAAPRSAASASDLSGPRSACLRAHAPSWPSAGRSVRARVTPVRP